MAEIIETCPICGHDIVDLILASNPPIPQKKCYNCGWCWTGEREEVVRFPFGGNTYTTGTTTRSDMEYINNVLMGRIRDGKRKCIDLIDRNALIETIEGIDWYHVGDQGNLVLGARSDNTPLYKADDIYNAIKNAKTVDAVEVEDKELLKAIKMLIEQYGHSKQSEYVHNPVAHALYHTWRRIDIL